MTTNEAAERLRKMAEDTLIWQDEWDQPSSDGSAVQDFIDAASPRDVLDALAAAKAEGAREAVQRIRLLALSGDWCITDHNRLLAVLDGEAAR